MPMGVYDIDIEDYACTRRCPLPPIPDETTMQHDWADATITPEYQDTLR